MSLAPVDAIALRAARASWFAAVGETLADAERQDAARYLAGLGLVDVAIAPATDWAHAKSIADSPDWEPAWWDAEERQRQDLLEAATARHGRPTVLVAVSRATQAGSDAAHGQAALALVRAGVADPALARAAAGAATQACYLAALAAAAGVPPEHAFLAKLGLFEAGRWPLGIVARRLHVF